MLLFFPGDSSASATFRRCYSLARVPKLLRSRQAYRLWVEGAFKDFYSQDGAELTSQFRGKLIEATPKILRLHHKSLKHPEEKTHFTSFLLQTCKDISTHDLRHSSAKLRSFNDITVEVGILRVFLEVFAELSPRTTAADLACQWLEYDPASRALLVALGQLELARGRIEAAIDLAHKALAVTSACTAAQKLLGLAWTAKLKQNPSAVCTDMAVGDLSQQFCSRPFTTLSTTPSGHTWLCDCGGWLPYSGGDFFQAESAEAVWNSATAIEIRRSILDGDFSYCSRTLCPHLIQNTLPKKLEVKDPILSHYIQNRTTRIPDAPTFVQLSHDETCNLACPTCRKTVIVADAAQQERLNAGRERTIIPLLRQVKGMVLITGWGDPFASKHYRSIMAALNPTEFPSLKLEISTNGLLLTAQEWQKLEKAHSMINRIKVSIDAATAETYQIVRPPGRWSQLMANLEFLASVRRQGQLKEFWINFVVQKANFREMLEFIKLGKRLGVNKVFFQKLWNIGAVPAEAFAEMDVASPNHPLHQELLHILQDPLMKDPVVLASNLQLVFNEAAAEN